MLHQASESGLGEKATVSPRKRFAQRRPRTHISTMAKIIEPPMEGPFGGECDLSPQAGAIRK